MMTAASTDRAPKSDEVSYFDPQDFLVNILRRAIGNRQDIEVSLAGVGEIQLLSSSGTYLSTVTDMRTFCAVPATRFTVTVLPDDSLRQPGTHVGRNIDELLWQAAFYASRGRLMKGCHVNDVVQLRHWPNLSRLPQTPNTLRISAVLAHYPTSIWVASRLLKVESPELYQFYSAARAAGLAHVLNRQPEEPLLKPHRNHTLLSMLLGKIANL